MCTVGSTFRETGVRDNLYLSDGHFTSRKRGSPSTNEGPLPSRSSLLPGEREVLRLIPTRHKSRNSPLLGHQSLVGTVNPWSLGVVTVTGTPQSVLSTVLPPPPTRSTDTRKVSRPEAVGPGVRTSAGERRTNSSDDNGDKNICHDRGLTESCLVSCPQRACGRNWEGTWTVRSHGEESTVDSESSFIERTEVDVFLG